MTMKFSLSIIPGIALAVLFGSVSGQFDFEDISPQATVFETTSLMAEESQGAKNGPPQPELTDNPTWIIDPLDGTMNYVHGTPFIAISVALFVEKKPVLGIIYNPILEQMFTAKVGQGSFLNGKPIRVTGQKDLSKSLVIIDLISAAKFLPLRDGLVIRNLQALFGSVQGFRIIGSAALSMAMVAAGQADAYFEYGIKAWDMAAGQILIQEAGGVVIDPEGGPYFVMNRRVMSAGTEELTKALMDKLPTDDDGNFLPRYMASVGNGHISTTLYTDTVYMNGLYNGERGESHRARIPSKNNIRVTPAGSDVVTNHVFGLDVAKGYFYEKFTINGTITVEQRTFAHRYYNKVLVTQIIFNATGTNSETQVFLASDSGDPSVDVTFGTERPFNSQYVSNATIQCGQANDLEDPTYQSAKLNVCVVSTAMPTSIQYNPTGSKSVVNFFASYDFVEADAAADFEAVAKLDSEGSEDIFNSHANAWAEVWEEGAIEVEGNTDLSKVIYGSLYYILSSLPVTTATNTPVRQFYGLSPGGLAYGEKLMDYQGHSFWDTETWMYPTFAYMFPKTAQQILNYRLSVLQAARDRANETGYKGSRFPWEAAVTGREVTPDCCPETRDLQIHITGDISYAVRQYIAITRDLDWLKVTKPGYIANGCTMVREMAEFWASRAEFNSNTGLYDILGVMPPDEDNHGVDNNPYTNIGAGYSIFFAKYAECLCSGDMQAIPDEWLTIAKSLALLYDAEHDYHPEFDGYIFGTPIKQADVVLIGFPQLYNMAASTRRNDLLIYENVTRDDGPAMTWAMHTIGFLELDDIELAESIFNKSYQSYMRQPYKIWTEARPPTLGAINFITGMGGFLQSIVSGYGGYRLYPEKIVFQKPRVPPQTTGLKIKGLDYLENSFDLYVTSTSVIFTLQKTTGKFPLIIERDGEQFPFTTIGGSVMFQQTASNPIPELTMYGTNGTQCELPLDKIGEPVAQKTYQKYTKKV